MSEYILEMKNITKEFPGVKALSNVNLQIRRGEIHSLCGENGAGKSTLMKVLSGVYPYKSYTGDIVINGEVQKFHKISDSEKAGVAIIYQELALVKDITVAENILLGKLINKKGIVNWNAVYMRAKKILEEMEVSIDLNEKVRNIGVGQQQLVEIAKALALDADILILDEPTAALTESEVETLLKIMKKLREKGVTCIMISHKLNEVFEVSDNITVLRDGLSIRTMSAKETNEDEVIKYMVGRELTQRYPEMKREAKETMLEVEHLNLTDPSGHQVVKDVSFSVRAGEIVGLAGLMGAGRTETTRAIFGVDPKESGEICVDGKEVRIRCPEDAIKNGVVLAPEDRKKDGLCTKLSIRHNLALPNLDLLCNKLGVVSSKKEAELCKKAVSDLKIKTPNVEIDSGNLSGGNQQKVVVGKWLARNSRVVIFDEPTRGIDVGAKVEIYHLMNELKQKGIAVIFVSSEMPEVMGIADRIIVMCDGRITGEILAKEATQEQILTMATSFENKKISAAEGEGK